MSTDSLTKKTLSGFKWSSISAVIYTGLRFVVLSILAHLLLPHDFGVIGIALIFTSFAERVGQVGVGPALVQLPELNDSITRTAAVLSLLVGSMMYAALYYATPFIADFFKEPLLEQVLPIIAFVFVFEGISVVPQSLLERDLRFKALLFIEVGSYALGYVLVGITLAYWNYGVWSLVCAMLIARFVKMLTLLIIERPRFTLNFKWQEVSSLLKLGTGFSLGRLLTYAALQGDNFVVGKFLGVSTLGMYTRAYQLMSLPAMCFGQVLDKVLFPAMAKRQNDATVLSKVYLTSVESIALISMPASVAMAFAAQEIVLVLFGAKWLEIVPALQILSMGIFFRTAYKSADTLVRSLGAVYHHAARQLVYVLCVILGSWLGSFAGLEGVAAAIFIAVGVNYALMSRLALQKVKLPFSTFLLAHLPGVWLAVLSALVLPLTLSFARSHDYAPLIRLLIATIPLMPLLLLASLFAPAKIRARHSLQILAKVLPPSFSSLAS